MPGRLRLEHRVVDSLKMVHVHISLCHIMTFPNEVYHQKVVVPHVDSQSYDLSSIGKNQLKVHNRTSLIYCVSSKI